MFQGMTSGMSAGRGGGGIGRLALIGNFLPRQCGIATFTSHVYDALKARFPAIATDVYAMNDPGRSYPYPPAVTATIDQNDVAGYRQAGASITARRTDLIWVQHEFGIFGGPAGAYLIDLLEWTAAPVIVTLHTVLAEPTPEQRLVMERLLRRASLVIVMADRARAMLDKTYGDLADRVVVIPRRIHLRSRSASARFPFPYRRSRPGQPAGPDVSHMAITTRSVIAAQSGPAKGKAPIKLA